MKFLKGFVKNRSRPEGCIVEHYSDEECACHCSGYMKHGAETGVRYTQIHDFENEKVTEGRPILQGKSKTMTSEMLKIAHRYVLFNIADCDPYIEDTNVMQCVCVCVYVCAYALQEEKQSRYLSIQVSQSHSNPKIEPSKSVAASCCLASLPASRLSGTVSRLRHRLRLRLNHVKEFEDDNNETPPTATTGASATHITTTRNSHLLRLNSSSIDTDVPEVHQVPSKKSASEIPTPQFVVVDTYERDYSRTFSQPNSYLRARGARAELGDFVEYDLDNEDEDWLHDFNIDRKLLAPEK
ncbi:hypothetical protein Dsin_018762 [Dipteronia sinensis]|uniref:Enhancer of polycomb-like protein n=1 Tax=Dipteronia sinensis TaxID=43782 RepID=A0AAE0E2D2_9ROSI|nr:hypothetical protein Dsin_018762 [Dipteronia sinensis]